MLVDANEGNVTARLVVELWKKEVYHVSGTKEPQIEVRNAMNWNILGCSVGLRMLYVDVTTKGAVEVRKWANSQTVLRWNV